MARGDDKTGSKGRVKFRFIEFEMDGSDGTLQSTIREITQAMQGGGRTVVIKQTPALAKGNGDPPELAANGAAFSEAELEEPVVEEEQESGAGDKPRKYARKFKSPKIVDVELRAGDMPLKKFLASPPDSVAKRYLLITYWFKTYRDVAEVTPDHIYTAYREMGWTTLPKDSAAPLRNLAQSGQLVKGEGELAYALNHIGEGKAQDEVKKMHPVA